MKCPYCDGTGVCEATFGARLRAARNDARLTQEAVAPHLGVSRAQLANLEANRSEPSIKVLRSAMTVFGHSADWFLGLDNT